MKGKRYSVKLNGYQYLYTRHKYTGINAGDDQDLKWPQISTFLNIPQSISYQVRDHQSCQDSISGLPTLCM